MDVTDGDRRVRRRRNEDATGSEAGEGAIRPINSSSAIEHARRLLELGVTAIEQRPDGRLWATGVDRRQRDRRRD